MAKQVDVFYSLQSDYCYFLLDRLIALKNKNVTVNVKPVLGGVLRLPERYKDRDKLEQDYFYTDTKRTAEFLNLPFAYPDPSPIVFEPGSLWIPAKEQPLNEYLYRLYVGSYLSGKALDFLDHIGRMLWDGSTPKWNEGNHLSQKMAHISLNLDQVLNEVSWVEAKRELDKNAEELLNSGHWGVPLMIYEGEPFYGQDRFDQLLWRMGL